MRLAACGPTGSLRPDNASLRSTWTVFGFGTGWQQRAGEIHKEALKNGDAYAIVWFDPNGEVTIYPQRAGNVRRQYDEEQPGRILWAAKYWRTTDKRTRLNLFYPDRIERYVTKRERVGGRAAGSERLRRGRKSKVQWPGDKPKI